jgi:ribonucleoside-diphosphate reductase alpha chain
LGVNLSFIRPNGSYIVGTGARTPGVVKFMELWDKASDVITMGSSKVINDKFTSKAKKKIRKGAMLAAMDISHPEIKDFIIAKQTSNRLTKFNLSVLVPDRFMKALDAN